MVPRFVIYILYLISSLSFFSCGKKPSLSGGYQTEVTTGDAVGGTSSTITKTSSTVGSTNQTPNPQQGNQSTGSNLGEKAYLHVNLWNKFHNFRSWCGTEKTFAWQCRHIKAKYPNVDCTSIEQKARDCQTREEANPDDVEYGFVGFKKQDAEHQDLCHGSLLDDDGGCDYRRWDLDDKLHFYWYGPRWGSNWPVATVKVFAGAGKKYTDTDEVVGLSNRQATKDRSATGVNRGGTRISTGCVIIQNEGQDEYHAPFGAFAWIEVPTDTPVTVVGVSGAIFGDDFSAFGRDRGSAPVLVNHNPSDQAAAAAYWAANPPNGGTRVGYSTYTEEVIFKKGKQYYWGHGSIEEVQAVPDDIKAGFALLDSKKVEQPVDCQ